MITIHLEDGIVKVDENSDYGQFLLGLRKNDKRIYKFHLKEWTYELGKAIKNKIPSISWYDCGQLVGTLFYFKIKADDGELEMTEQFKKALNIDFSQQKQKEEEYMNYIEKKLFKFKKRVFYNLEDEILDSIM